MALMLTDGLASLRCRLRHSLSTLPIGAVGRCRSSLGLRLRASLLVCTSSPPIGRIVAEAPCAGGRRTHAEHRHTRGVASDIRVAASRLGEGRGGVGGGASGGFDFHLREPRSRPPGERESSISRAKTRTGAGCRGEPARSIEVRSAIALGGDARWRASDVGELSPRPYHLP